MPLAQLAQTAPRGRPRGTPVDPPAFLGYDADVRPTREQLEVLSRTERLALEIGDYMARPRFTRFSEVYLSVVMGSLIYSCCGRRLRIVGLDALEPTSRKDRVLLVANHRSFFDFYTITAVLFWRTKFPKRIFFPTRSTFFYDHPAGPLVNLSMSAMRMFPPILRDGSRGTFNNWAIDRCVAELNTPGTIVGIHPEGTRNKSDDPYAFLPAQPGAGRLALCADPEVRVIPVFALGTGNSIASEMKKNITAPEDHPTSLYFGAPLDFADLRARGIRATTAKRAADRCLDAIRALAEQHRRDTGAARATPARTERVAG